MSKIISQCTPQDNDSLSTWFTYLQQNFSTRVILGLDRVSKVARALSLTNGLDSVIFTVAGTNGKGTTCHALESILLAAGYKVGLYTSPHLLRYTERIRIQGKELPDTFYGPVFSMIEKARLKQQVSLTFFEYTTLAALCLFRQANLDAVILEVGLGGRLDAVNIIDADVAILTTVSIDHTQWLGQDRDSIGREKAGIFRKNRLAIIGELNPPVSVIQVAKSLGAQLVRRGVDWSFSKQSKYWTWQNEHIKLEQLPIPQIPLVNAATAIAALHYSILSIKPSIIAQALAQVALPGRFQIVKSSPCVILDVAHNPQSSAYLAEQLLGIMQKRPLSAKLHVVVGILGDKDAKEILKSFKIHVDNWYCASLLGKRSREASSLLKYLPRHAQACSCVERAWQKSMKNAQERDVVVVFGSFHTVSEVMRLL